MRFGVACCLVGLSLIGLCTAQESHAAIRKNTNIPAEPLDQALRTLAKERQFQVLYRAELVRDVRSEGAVGEYTPEEALKQLLSGTGLSYKYLDASTVTIVPVALVTAGATTDQPQRSESSTQDKSKEAGKNSSQDFRVAQVDQAPNESQAVTDRRANEKAKNLEEVVVTGSRIPITSKETPQDVKVYTQEQIERSGQTTVADFLNTLPEVSQNAVEGPFQSPAGGTTVQLHGLPVGTTLVLLNGRRLEDSGAQAAIGFNFFDLNLIPVSAIERIEVLTAGSSAVYGSDAIAGVVNIILKSNIEGLDVVAKYGAASNINDTSVSLDFGHRWQSGAASIIGSYQTRGDLYSTERSLTANQDFTRFGGPDSRVNSCMPGNVFSPDGVTPLPGLGTATFAAVPGGFTGKPSIAEFAGTAGTLNACNSPEDLIPATRRLGAVAQVHQNLSSKMEVFAELMLSHLEQYTNLTMPQLFGVPGFQSYTVSASNPYNPFGEAVGIANVMAGVGPSSVATSTVLVRPVVGVRGSIIGGWEWEFSGWDNQDWTKETNRNFSFFSQSIQDALNSSNPATALNPFVDAPIGSTKLLQSLLTSPVVEYNAQKIVTTGFVRGSVWQLPGGAVELVLGGEYDRDKLWGEDPRPVIGGDFSDKRHNYAVFGEARVPILKDQSGARELTLTAAQRYDNYSDFGGHTTPQFGIDWRPVDALLVRGAYGRAFVAPSLSQISFVGGAVPGTLVSDPLHGNQIVPVIESTTANLSLKPETGASHSFGLVYSNSPDAAQRLQFSIGQWSIKESESIQFLGAQTIVSNEALFPGNVIRSPSVNGEPGTIIEVIDGYVNFGTLDVAGVDYHASDTIHTGFGELSAAINASQIYRYSAALIPGAVATNRVSAANDDGNWAPRWKGTVILGWKLGQVSTALTGRYVGIYQDYDSTRKTGNFWFGDANVRLDLPFMRNLHVPFAGSSFVEFGAINLFNRLPPYSNYAFGTVGYDAAEADIRGRFLYGRVGVSF